MVCHGEMPLLVFVALQLVLLVERARLAAGVAGSCLEGGDDPRVSSTAHREVAGGREKFVCFWGICWSAAVHSIPRSSSTARDIFLRPALLPRQYQQEALFELQLSKRAVTAMKETIAGLTRKVAPFRPPWGASRYRRTTRPASKTPPPARRTMRIPPSRLTTARVPRPPRSGTSPGCLFLCSLVHGGDGGAQRCSPKELERRNVYRCYTFEVHTSMFEGIPSGVHVIMKCEYS